MSDLFKDDPESKNDEEFTPYDHLLSICEGGRIELRVFGNVDYKKGWSGIVETLIKTMKKHPIEISSITSEYGQLDVNFIFSEKTREVAVWRALNIATHESRKTCMRCGNGGRRMVRGEKMIVMCRYCLNEDEENGITGTWLDKY